MKLERGQRAAARHHLYQVLPGSQKYTRAQFELGRAELLEGRPAPAARLFRRVLKANGQDRSAREALAYALRQMDHSREAANELAALDALDPTSAFVAAEKMFARTGSTTAVDQRVVRHVQGYLQLAAAYMRLGAWEARRRNRQPRAGSFRRPPPTAVLLPRLRAGPASHGFPGRSRRDPTCGSQGSGGRRLLPTDAGRLAIPP